MYTKEQIKAAFWEMFHKSGESWFPYFDDSPEREEHCKTVTEQAFTEFMASLKEQTKAGPNV